MCFDKKQTIYIGSDHAGYLAKQALIELLKKQGYQIEDIGTNSTESCNYAEYAIEVGNQVVCHPNSVGIVICGTGVGVCMAVNKVPGILCGVAYNQETARLIKEHDNCNVLALGAREFDVPTLFEFCLNFLNATFQAGRHCDRINYIQNYEQKKLN